MNTLIAKYLKNKLSDSERIEFDQWLSENSGNQQKLDEIQLIWEESGHIRKGYKPATENAWQQLLEEITNQSKKSRELYQWVSGIAASVILVGFLAFLYINNNTAVNYVALADVTSSIELPDGSVVWINKNSELSFEEGERSRRIKLKGEAYFDVVSSPEKPFTIQTGELTTRVVGTSFNVNASGNNSIDVVVTSGKVLVFHETDSIFLDPGEQGVYDQHSQSLIERPTSDLNFDAWKTGILVFRDAPMNEVIRDLEKLFDTKLTLNDSIDVRLNGSFDNQSLDEILEVIALTTDVQIKKQTDEK